MDPYHEKSHYRCIVALNASVDLLDSAGLPRAKFMQSIKTVYECFMDSNTPCLNFISDKNGKVSFTKTKQTFRVYTK